MARTKNKRKQDGEMGPPAKRREVEQKERANELLGKLEENRVVGIEEEDAEARWKRIVAEQKEANEKAFAIPEPSPSWLCAPLHEELERTYATTMISIFSAAAIRRKVTRALEVLDTFDASKDTGTAEANTAGGAGDEVKKDPLVVLHAKAKVAVKLITIAEIVKREIGEKGGKWFQYNSIGTFMEEVPANLPNVRDRRSAANDNHKPGTNITEEAEAEEEEEGEAFETMKTPFERAIEGTPKVKAVPVITVYLSRVRVESLKKQYGEQTNGLGKEA